MSNHPDNPQPAGEPLPPEDAAAKAALHTRRAFLFKLSLALNAAVGLVLAIPLVGYLLGPAMRKKNAASGAWIALGSINDFPVGETRLASFRSPAAAFLFKLSLALNSAVGLVLAIPLVGYLLGPAMTRKNAASGAWIALGSINDFPVGETRLASFRSPAAAFDDGDTAKVAC